MIKLFTLFRKCLGEARWSRYPTWKEKFEVFKVLFRLRYYGEIRNDQDGFAKQSIFGFEVNGSSYREILYLFREIFLGLEYNLQFSRSDPRILDCGANIGMSILFFKRLYANAKILAFEPNPKTFEFLQKNVFNNHLKDVEIMNVGLAEVDAEADFFFNPSNSLIGSIHASRGGQKGTKVIVKKLSSFMGQESFDLAKIDVEGSEIKIMWDLEKSGTLKQINQYAVEYHHNLKHANSDLSEFLKFFDRNGFTYSLKASFQKPGDVQDILITTSRERE